MRSSVAFEHGGNHLARNSDSRVEYRDAQLDLRCVYNFAVYYQPDVATVGKFHSVSQEIRNDLAQPPAVPDHIARAAAVFNFNDQINAFLGSRRAEHFHQSVDQTNNVKRA